MQRGLGLTERGGFDHVHPADWGPRTDFEHKAQFYNSLRLKDVFAFVSIGMDSYSRNGDSFGGTPSDTGFWSKNTTARGSCGCSALLKVKSRPMLVPSFLLRLVRRLYRIPN